MPTGPIIISFYSHKGGVGKTTSIHNFAHLLATELKYRVLLIDADPQCSLTSLLIEEEELKRQEERAESSPPSNSCRNIYECFQFTEGTGAILPNPSDLQKRVRRVETHNINDNLFFLQGSSHLHRLDKTVGMAFSGAFNMYEQVPAVLGYFFRVLGIEKKADIILLDLNPGATALNAALLMGSNYFLVPIIPDHFSVQAIKSLSYILPKWQKKMEHLRKSKETEKLLYHLPAPPKLLSILPQRIDMHRGGPVRACEKWLKDVCVAVEKTLYPALLGVNMVSEGTPLTKAGFIKDFHAVGIATQQKRCPIVALKQKSENIQKIKDQFRRAVYDSLRNLKQQDREKLSVSSAFRRLGILMRQEDQEDKKNCYELPLPVSKEALKNWLFAHADEEILRECAAYDFIHIISDKSLPADIYSSVSMAGECRSELKKLREAFSNLIDKHQELIQDSQLFSVKDYSLTDLELKLNAIKNDHKDKTLQEDIANLGRDIRAHINKYRSKLSLKTNYIKYINIWFSEINTYFILPEGKNRKEPICLLDAIVTLLKLKMNVFEENEQEEVQSILYSFGDGSNLGIDIMKYREIGYHQYRLMSKSARLKDVFTEITNTVSIEMGISDDIQEAIEHYKSRWVNAPARDKNKKEPQMIALFNHKGGVGKTTTTFNLGYMLAEKAKKKVMLVDLDSQCNLTSLIMQEEYKIFFEENEKKVSEIKDCYRLMSKIIDDGTPVKAHRVSLYKTGYDNMLLLRCLSTKLSRKTFILLQKLVFPFSCF